MSNQTPAHSFVFIGGLHRSGTTLLHDCLADHPRVSGLSDTGVPMNEGQFLQDVYAPAGTRRKLWPIRYLRPVAPDFLTSRGYGGPGRFGFDPGAHLTERAPLATPGSARRIFDAWAPYWQLDRPVLVEKSPPNLLRMRFLQALFPDTRFVALYRHPVAVSYATRRWAAHRPLHFLFDHWLHCYRVFEQDRAQLRHVLVLRYEDFITEPQATMDRMHDFLGLERIPVAREVSASGNVSYFRRWSAELQRGGVRGRYAAWVRDRYEAAFQRYGYTLAPERLGDGRGVLDAAAPASLAAAL